MGRPVSSARLLVLWGLQGPELSAATSFSPVSGVLPALALHTVGTRGGLPQWGGWLGALVPSRCFCGWAPSLLGLCWFWGQEPK